MTDKAKQIMIRFPDLGIELTADLLWDHNPELCELLLKNLPETTHLLHTMASGEGTYGPMRAVGALKSTWEDLTEIPIGTVIFNIENYKSFSLWYGKSTEPLPARRVGLVVEKDLDALRAVGKEVWYSTYLTHKPIVMQVSVAASH